MAMIRVFCCCSVLQTLMFGQSPALYFLKPENPEGEQAYVRFFLSPLMGETKAACCSFKGWFIGENLLEMPFLCTFFSYLTIFKGTDSMWNILITYSGIIIDILTKFTADAITLSFLTCSAHWGNTLCGCLRSLLNVKQLHHICKSSLVQVAGKNKQTEYAWYDFCTLSVRRCSCRNRA